MIIPDTRIGYDLNVKRQYACLVNNLIMVDNFALLNCTPVDRASNDLKLSILVGWDRSSFIVAWSTRAQMMIASFRFPVVLFGLPGISICHAIHCIC